MCKKGKNGHLLWKKVLYQLELVSSVSGIATVLAVDILMIPQLNTTELAEGLQWGFLATMPNFCLGQGVVTLYNNYQYLNICTTPIIEFACQNNVTLPCCKGRLSKMEASCVETYP